MDQFKPLDISLRSELNRGLVIPAHPLSLFENRKLNEENQRLLTRYYLASGAGGVAIGVHTTQFEIRKPEINLLETVLRLCAEEIDHAELKRPFLKVAGICGPTDQALHEAELANKYGFHLGLLSNGGLADYSEEALLQRAVTVSQSIPIFGFYLQPAAGGRILSFEFWKELVKIPNVYAIKIAAFNRYQTLDVVRAVCESERRNEIALYTGNDDNIVADLLTPYRFEVNGEHIEKRFVGGLLGHWAVCTSKAVSLLDEIHHCIAHRYAGVEKLLVRGVEVTDMNAAIFDAQHLFKGCISGIHEILYRQGILKGTWCLDPTEKLSRGQLAAIDRVSTKYPILIDDDFVRWFLDEELKK